MDAMRISSLLAKVLRIHSTDSTCNQSNLQPAKLQQLQLKEKAWNCRSHKLSFK